MSLILSVDDGCASDMRVAELARKYNIEAVFYWPVEWRSLAYSKGYEPLTWDQAQAIAKQSKIGCHGYTHRYLTRIPLEEAKLEIADSKKALEAMFGQTIEDICFPRGYTNDAIDDFVLSIGLRPGRLTRGFDNDGYKLVHVHPNSGANDNLPWQECITKDTHLWMHSFDLDRYDLWGELEGVISAA